MDQRTAKRETQFAAEVSASQSVSSPNSLPLLLLLLVFLMVWFFYVILESIWREKKSLLSAGKPSFYFPFLMEGISPPKHS